MAFYTILNSNLDILV